MSNKEEERLALQAKIIELREERIAISKEIEETHIQARKSVNHLYKCWVEALEKAVEGAEKANKDRYSRFSALAGEISRTKERLADLNRN